MERKKPINMYHNAFHLFMRKVKDSKSIGKVPLAPHPREQPQTHKETIHRNVQVERDTNPSAGSPKETKRL